MGNRDSYHPLPETLADSIGHGDEGMGRETVFRAGDPGHGVSGIKENKKCQGKMSKEDARFL